MSAKVFISHSSADEKVASAICTALENRGLACWIAGRDVGPGENFQEAIVRAIRAAKVMVLVFTENANNSHEIKKELVLAGQNNLVIIPARVENVAPNDALAYEFATRQWVDLFKDWEREIERLSAWVAGILSIDPAVAVAPIPSKLTVQPFESTALANTRTSGSKNPLHHFVAAFLLILGVASLGSFFADAAEQFGILAAARAGSRNAVCTSPDGCPWESANWSATVTFLIASVALFAAGLGTIRRRNWARFLGLGLCVIGFLLATYFTVASAAAAYNSFNFKVDPSAPRGVPTLPGDPIVPVGPDPLPDLICTILLLLLALTFACCGATYAWGWQSRLATQSNEPRKARLIALAYHGEVFGAAIIFVCALTVGIFYLYQRATGRGDFLWSAVLVAVDAVVFVVCFIRFRKEFDAQS